jgi:methylglutaconyl-CoA hydratase
MAEPVMFELDSSGIATLVIQRADVRNALNWGAMHALGESVAKAHAVQGLRAVILTGAGGKAFISGGDLRELKDMTEEDGLRQHDLMTGILGQLAALPVPVIAAMEGAARGGGCEVALACDLRIAAEDATLAFAQISMAVTPGWGGARRLFHLTGYSRAMDLLLTGRAITAQEALELGLVNLISPPGGALDAARALAEELAAGPLLGVRGVKEVLRGYLTMPEDAAMTRERLTFAQLWASADHGEAVAAFLEKRSPLFKGK